MKHTMFYYMLAFSLAMLAGVGAVTGAGAGARAGATPNPTATYLIATPQRATRALSGGLDEWGDLPPYNLDVLPAVVASGVNTVAVGHHHALAVTDTGRVYGWGTNMRGELTIPASVRSGVVSVAVGKNHSVALKADGSVVFWGDAATLPPVGSTLPTEVVQISAAGQHTLLLRSNGTVVAYGGAPVTELPSRLSLVRVVAIASGLSFGAALTESGDVITWGVAPVGPAVAMSDVRAIWAGGTQFAVLRRDGRLIVSGNGSEFAPTVGVTGQFFGGAIGSAQYSVFEGMAGVRAVEFASWGIGIIRQDGTPVAIPFVSSAIPTSFPVTTVNALGMYAGHAAGVFLHSEMDTRGTATPEPMLLSPVSPREMNALGFLRVWGANQTLNLIPAAANGVPLRQVVAGTRFIAVLRADGSVVAWGDNSDGQTNVPAAVQAPFELQDPLRVHMLAAGASHVLALRADGTVLAWGNNDAGQATVPPGLTDVVQVAAGYRHSVALKKNGTVVVWGDNTYGQRNQPSVTGAIKIAAGGWHTVALKRNQTVVGWGRNTDGQVTLPPMNSVVDIVANQNNTAVLLATGRVAVYGRDDFQQLTVPDERFARIGAGMHHFMGMTLDGRWVGWGLNTDGQANNPWFYQNVFMMVGGIDFSAMLSRTGYSFYPTSTPTPTLPPKLPPIATAEPSNVHDGVTLIAAGDTVRFASYPLSAAALGPGTITALVDESGNLSLNGGYTDSTACIIVANNEHPEYTQQVVSVAFTTQVGVALYRDRSLYAWENCDWSGAGKVSERIPRGFRTNVKQFAVNSAPYAWDSTEQRTHIVVLTLDNRLWSSAVQLPSFTNPIRQVAATTDGVIVLFQDGTLWSSAALPAPPASATDIIEIAAGDTNVVALRRDGTVVTWGSDPLHVGVLELPFDATHDVVHVRADGNSAAALHADGTVDIWGVYPVGTTAALGVANQRGDISEVLLGRGRIMLFTRNTAPVVYPTATSVILPTAFPHNLNPLLRSNQIGAFQFDTAQRASKLQFAGQRYMIGAQARMSSVQSDSVASYVLDRRLWNPTAPYANAVTQYEERPWIEVDLGAEREIGSVVIYPSQFVTQTGPVVNNTIDQLNGSLVLLGSTSFGTETDIATLKSQSTAWKCVVSDTTDDCYWLPHRREAVTFPAGTRARFVRIQSTHVDALSVNEIVVSAPAYTMTCVMTQCPDLQDTLVDYTMTKAARFRENRGDEATGTTSANLTGSFTIQYAVRRDAAYHHDVVVAAGTPGATRRYLVSGIDQENRPYCSFTGDDLRSPIAFPDTDWHRYTCVYNAASRVRKLFRDGTLISQDVASAPNSIGSVPLVVGRRYDTMEGLNGSVAELMVSERAWSDSEVYAATLDPFAVSAVVNAPGTAPNRSQLVCTSPSTCPEGRSNPSDAHDGPFVFVGTGQSYQVSDVPSGESFSIAMWSMPLSFERPIILASRSNPNGTAFHMGIRDSAFYCSTIAVSGEEDLMENRVSVTLEASEIGTWHMYGCTYQAASDSFTVYRDGVAAVTGSAATIRYTTPWIIGGNTGAPNVSPLEMNQPFDDLFVYDTGLSPALMWLLYRDTVPDESLPTMTPGPDPHTATPSPTRTPSFTATPTAPKTRTRLPATMTVTDVVNPTDTVTLTWTRSRTPTRTLSPTRTKSLTPTRTSTRTPTIPTLTPVRTATTTPTITKTALVVTRTWLARRSPTWGAQTQTATALVARQTATAYAATLTAGRPTLTQTLTAYPLPPTETPWPTAYPAP